MAAPSKQSSRWGAFLQQAVAGVESRLDTILAEGPDENSSSNKPATSISAATGKSDSNISRSASSSSKTNDRLQERLARAIAAKNNAQKTDSLAPSSTPSRNSSPATVIDSPRGSLDVENVQKEDNAEPTAKPETNINGKDVVGEQPTIQLQPSALEILKWPDRDLENNSLTTGTDNEVGGRLSTESTRSSVPRESIDSSRHILTGPRSFIETPSVEITNSEVLLKSPEEYEALVKQLQSDYEISELQRQEEVHGYIERIDALQAKLQYLAKESAESARKSSTAAAAGSIEKRLADKEEQVALLMEEGQKLSKKELNHLTTIKKLRAKIQEDSKDVAEAKRKQERAETETAFLMDRLKRSEGSEKLLNEKQRMINQLQKDIESLKVERDSKDSTIASLKVQLEQAIAQEKQAEVKQTNEALQAERKRASDLEDDVANLKIEKSLIADRSQSQIKELREKIEKDAERARITELEMKSEQQMLESKLEVMRARAEEVSSGATGDAQAKLLRQIETLQTQYAVASENFQGIEASLIARATNLEKERDEATRREADIRKKAREITLKAKRNEEELEESRAKLPTFQQELANHKAQLDNLQNRATEAEVALVEAKARFDQEKQAWGAELLQRIDEERQKWQEESAGQGSFGISRAESPALSTRRGLTSEYLGLQNLQLRRASARSTTSDVPTVDRLLPRRPSANPIGRTSGNGTPIRQDSVQSLLSNGEGLDTPSIHTDHDDLFEQNQSPTSPHQTINDMVSASTAAAGPSVQLMERLSSSVRRLESEKAAAKEENARLSKARNEARAEIVALMREVEAKRAADSRISELEAEVQEIKSRYETTLEMLGEKSEIVDEQRSDIDDLKAMYRELVERTVK